MANRHLDDPLDYLYEELPPERMAEARRHLAECPQCREEVAEIRETVKTYRQLPRPQPPEGLAQRVAAQILAETGKSEPQPAAAPPQQANAESDLHYEQIRREVLGDMRMGWRRWLFHPAWTVAASVVFVCAVLIHLSPRRDMAQFSLDHPPLPYAPPAMPAPAASPAKAAIAGSALPAASGPTAGATDAASVSAAPPSRDEGAETATEAQAEPAPARQSAPVAPTIAADAVAARETMTDEAGNGEETAGKAEMDAKPDAGAKPPAAPRPSQAASVAAPVVVAAPPSFAASAAPSPKPQIIQPDREQKTAASPRRAREDAPAAGMPPPAPEEAGQKQPLAGGEDLVVFFSTPLPTEPPQLIERPPAIDTRQLVLNLAVLAGMQIGAGELEDALKTVAELNKLDPVEAARLRKLIIGQEKQAALARSEKTGEEDTANAASQPPAGDKYAGQSVAASSAIIAVPEGVADTAPAADAVADTDPAPALIVSPPPAPAEPSAPVLPETTEEPASPGDDAAPANRPEVSAASPEQAAYPVATEHPRHEIYIGPAYSEQDAGPPRTARDGDIGIQAEAAAPVAAMKAKPPQTAVPPTLGEISGFRFHVGPAARKRRVFTTDPYFRDE